MEFDYCLFEYWIGIAADLATCITAIGVIGAFIAYVKNRVSPKSFKVDFKITDIRTWENIKLKAKITFENYTDKEFSITGVLLCVNSEEYQILTPANKKLVPLSDIPITPYFSQTLYDNRFDIPFGSNLVGGTLKVKTTVGNFVYRIDLRNACNRINQLNKEFCASDASMSSD